jgi:hypothetical protein
VNYMKPKYIFDALLFVSIYVLIFSLSRAIFPFVFQYLEHLLSIFFTFLLATSYAYCKKLSMLNYLTLILFLVLAFNVLTILSMNIDRSRSVEVLVIAEEAENRNLTLLETLEICGIKTSDIPAFVQRFDEQSQMMFLAGNVNSPKLTLIGSSFLKIGDLFAGIWNLDGFRRITQTCSGSIQSELESSLTS